MLLDSYWPILILSLALGGITQWWVKSSFRRYSEVPFATGQTGAQVARSMLDANGLSHVTIERVAGELSDHYDPRADVLRLSPAVHDGRSIASAGVACHEAGHALQHARGFVFARVRSSLVPAAQLGSNMAFPLIFLGIFMNFAGLVSVGVALFAGAVLFQIVTLPVEFDASRRALANISSSGAVVASDQVDGARRVLTAAAMTYLAAALVAVLQLLYFIGLSRR